MYGNSPVLELGFGELRKGGITKGYVKRDIKGSRCGPSTLILLITSTTSTLF